MRHPETSGDNLQKSGISGLSLRRPGIGKITTYATVLAGALLAQCGHQPSRQHDVHIRVSGADAGKMMDPDRAAELEAMRARLTVKVRECASSCTVMEASTLASMCGDKPLTGEKLSQAASGLSPALRTQIHTIAEILRDCPELAPDVLTELHGYINELGMADPRRIAGLVIPASDPSLEDRWMVYRTAKEFLNAEEESGVYSPTSEMQVAESRTLIRRILTEQENSSENK